MARLMRAMFGVSRHERMADEAARALRQEVDRNKMVAETVTERKPRKSVLDVLAHDIRNRALRDRIAREETDDA